MKRWRRRLALLFLGALVGLTLTLLLISRLARDYGVREVSLPQQSLHARLTADTSDYTDSYNCPLPETSFNSIDDVERFAFQKGALVDRSERELLYRSRAPGLTFHVSYMLDDAMNPHSLTVSTTVRYENLLGRMYFGFVRPIHRRGVPFMIRRMVRASAGSG